MTSCYIFAYTISDALLRIFQSEQDEEGMQIMRYLGRNMAWLIKLKEVGIKAGVELPRQEENRVSTNFIR